ncbi:MAG: SH3 domain-containing protein [Treponema sp.]|nr:SH3 domain-containing protein [Treponema sp.]MCL2236703.1 SH3 domain-containing protein [Treponema sp.]
MLLLITLASAVFWSCSRIGYGVLLWSSDDPHVDSGTVLPVYLKSNIQQLWVVGIPESTRTDRDYKIEVPLSQLEFFNTRRAASKWASGFSEYATAYAENLQDRLPIRDNADNNARQIYRLRLGEIIKILGIARGIAPVGASGDPLPGNWYKVMTHDGVRGYCFSYRLRIFDNMEGSVNSESAISRDIRDPELDQVLSKEWFTDSYAQMVNTRRINIREMEKKYRFEPGYETGIARVILPDIERNFNFQRILPSGELTWRFDGTNLTMALRSNTTLQVQFTDPSGIRRNLMFVTLTSDINDLIQQETLRREAQYQSLYSQGPVFTSNNYGTITLLQTGDFTWTNYDLLVPQLIPASTKGSGRINMDLFIAPGYEDHFNGAFTMQFTDIRSNNTLNFMYAIDNQGLRMEVVPNVGIDDNTVMRRSTSPMVLYFFKDTSE